MKNPVNILLALIAIGLLFWVIFKGSNSSSNLPPVATEGVNTVGSTVFDVEGTDTKMIETRNASGFLTESGAMLNDMKTGSWTTYHPEERIKTISTYVGGKLNGPYIELTERGQIEIQCFYKDGFLDGKYAKYKSGSRKVETHEYKMGKLDGISRKYYDRKDQVQQEINYKDGLQEGLLRYFDEEGNVTMEYQYKNGEKISGGIVEKKPAAATE